jgi:hypothetical protein
VAVGALLGFAWNMTAGQPHSPVQDDLASTPPQVGLTVERTAEQAWAGATPRTATARTVTTGTPADGSCRARPPRTTDRLAVRVVFTCGCPDRVPRQMARPVRRIREG